MNFFTSVFSDDASGSDSDTDNAHFNDSSPTERRSEPSGAWEFGSLWKTLSANSESIIETYRRDLQEFGTGLRKEIEVAHDSLESVSHVIDHFGNTVVRGTAQIISHGKDAILIDSYYNNNDNCNNKINDEDKSLNSRRYSRHDAQVCAIQGDESTYAEVPEDLNEYNDWKSWFSLEGKSDEMEGLLRENEAMDSVYKRVVPSVVDRDTFWFRYYYRVYKFKKAEDVRARLVTSMAKEEEELSWDVEDDDDDEDDDGTQKLNVEEIHKNAEEGCKEEKKNDLLQSKGLGENKDETIDESKVDKSKEVVQEMGDERKKSDDGKDEKDEEKDFEWDELEDLSRNDQEKEIQTDSPTKADLGKRLSLAQEQEDEDLSWEIDDDADEPAKP